MQIVPRRVAAKIDGEFVVFLIGARLNKLWKLRQFKWVGDAMQAMLSELEQRPESGFLGYESFFSLRPTMIQYWRSPEQLMAYARSRDAVHYPAWVKFNKELSKNGDVGIWHETYIVRAGDYECVYNNMPPFGLARVSGMIDAVSSNASAAGRLGKSDGSDAPIRPDGTETS